MLFACELGYCGLGVTISKTGASLFIIERFLFTLERCERRKRNTYALFEVQAAVASECLQRRDNSKRWQNWLRLLQARISAPRLQVLPVQALFVFAWVLSSGQTGGCCVVTE